MQVIVALEAEMPNTGKTSRDRGKIRTQLRLSDFEKQSMEHKASKEANINEEANANANILEHSSKISTKISILLQSLGFLFFHYFIIFLFNNFLYKWMSKGMKITVVITQETF